MKNLIIVLLLFVTSLVFGQTTIISEKTVVFPDSSSLAMTISLHKNKITIQGKKITIARIDNFEVVIIKLKTTPNLDNLDYYDWIFGLGERHKIKKTKKQFASVELVPDENNSFCGLCITTKSGSRIFY
jgi:hypothetical protein